MNQSTARGLAFLFIGAVVATFFLIQLVMGVLSVIPLAVWLFLVLMAVCVLLRCCTGKQGEALREDLTEAQRKARVRTLQKEVSRLKMQLSDPIAQASLSRARQELNSLWKRAMVGSTERQNQCPRSNQLPHLLCNSRFSGKVIDKVFTQLQIEEKKITGLELPSQAEPTPGGHVLMRLVYSQSTAFQKYRVQAVHTLHKSLIQDAAMGVVE